MVRNYTSSLLDRGSDSTIHSGHFMLSSIHDDENCEQQSGHVVKELEDTSAAQQHDQKSVIDSSLAQLFKCLTLAYRFAVTLQYLCE